MSRRTRFQQRGRQAAAPPAMPLGEGLYQHPADQQPDPDADQYLITDNKDFAEGVHPGPYTNTPHPQTPTEGSGYMHPAGDPANLQHAPVDAKKMAAYTNKAAHLLDIAEKILGRNASDQELEDQALAMMDWSADQVRDTLHRMASRQNTVGDMGMYDDDMLDMMGMEDDDMLDMMGMEDDDMLDMMGMEDDDHGLYGMDDEMGMDDEVGMGGYSHGGMYRDEDDFLYGMEDEMGMDDHGMGHQASTQQMLREMMAGQASGYGQRLPQGRARMASGPRGGRPQRRQRPMRGQRPRRRMAAQDFDNIDPIGALAADPWMGDRDPITDADLNNLFGNDPYAHLHAAQQDPYQRMANQYAGQPQVQDPYAYAAQGQPQQYGQLNFPQPQQRTAGYQGQRPHPRRRTASQYPQTLGDVGGWSGESAGAADQIAQVSQIWGAPPDVNAAFNLPPTYLGLDF